MVYAIGILVVLAIGGVGYWIKRSLLTAVALDQREAALQVEREHITALEQAAARDRAQRAAELNAKVAAVTDAAGAAGLLADAFPGKPQADHPL